MPLEKGFELMKKGDYAYHAHPFIAYDYIEKHLSNREICEMTEVHLLSPTHTYFATNYNGSFVELSRRGYENNVFCITGN